MVPSATCASVYRWLQRQMPSAVRRRSWRTCRRSHTRPGVSFAAARQVLAVLPRTPACPCMQHRSPRQHSASGCWPVHQGMRSTLCGALRSGQPCRIAMSMCVRTAVSASQAPPDRVMTHIVPKAGTHGATLVAYAEADKFKMIVVGSRGLGAFRLCDTLPADIGVPGREARRMHSS